MLNKKPRIIFIFLFFVLALVGLIFIWRGLGHSVEIDNRQPANSAYQFTEGASANPLNGLTCANYQRRPIAVVLASDPVARPLSGLSQADLVFEMPVITGSITRMVAVYICNDPKEIGSLRSARHDFIPLVMGIDGILAHWGGSHFALDRLDAGIMDNIDALKNPYNAFYQKKGIPQPHNGFSSMGRLVNSAKKLGYRLKNKFEGYTFIPDSSQETSAKILRIGYAYPYNVSYQYEPKTNTYLRYRANFKEIDKNNSQQVQAKNIVIMRALSQQIEGPFYNDLDLEGTGECQIFQNGIVIPCYWQKSEQRPESKLRFVNRDTDKEVSFVPGQIWIEIVEPSQKVTWQ